MSGGNYMASIQDVAKLAGVSVATVSRVMNNATNVSPASVRKVQSAVESLNYSPNWASRNLRSKKSNMLLVVIPEFSNPFWGDILEGMEQEAQKYHYKLIITTSHSNIYQERIALSLLKQRQADGAILLSPVLPQAELIDVDENHPLIQCCEYTEDSPLPHVSIDNYSALCDVMEYLIRLGHTKIAMVSSTNHFVSTIQREKGYADTLAKHRIHVPDEYLLRGTYSYTSGYERMRQLLAEQEPPTAVVAISDTVAAGCLSAIDDSGLSCPNDIAVIGFDNIQLSSMLLPKLSTVSQPRLQLGATAVQMLLDRLNGNRTAQHIFLPHELVIRQSS